MCGNKKTAVKPATVKKRRHSKAPYPAYALPSMSYMAEQKQMQNSPQSSERNSVPQSCVANRRGPQPRGRYLDKHSSVSGWAAAVGGDEEPGRGDMSRVPPRSPSCSETALIFLRTTCLGKDKGQRLYPGELHAPTHLVRIGEPRLRNTKVSALKERRRRS